MKKLLLLAIVLGFFTGCREFYYYKPDFNLTQYQEDELSCREQALKDCTQVGTMQSYSKNCVRDHKLACMNRKGYTYTYGSEHKKYGVK